MKAEEFDGYITPETLTQIWSAKARSADWPMERYRIIKEMAGELKKGLLAKLGAKLKSDPGTRAWFFGLVGLDPDFVLNDKEALDLGIGPETYLAGAFMEEIERRIEAGTRTLH